MKGFTPWILRLTDEPSIPHAVGFADEFGGRVQRNRIVWKLAIPVPPLILILILIAGRVSPRGDGWGRRIDSTSIYVENLVHVVGDFQRRAFGNDSDSRQLAERHSRQSTGEGFGKARPESRAVVRSRVFGVLSRCLGQCSASTGDSYRGFHGSRPGEFGGRRSGAGALSDSRAFRGMDGLSHRLQCGSGDLGGKREGS